jgi:hypothetical protein
MKKSSFAVRATGNPNVGAKKKDNDGRLPLHCACELKAPVEVVSALLAVHPDGEAA